jgi:chemotaxis protein MotA
MVGRQRIGMFFLIGVAVVIVCVLGGYTAMGGHLVVLLQPFEFIIIAGSAVGAFIIGNPKWILSRAAKGVGQAMKGSPYKKDHYLELLSLLYQIFKLAKSKGMLVLEPHIENPDESELFANFPKFHANHHAVTFVCDYLRLISLGTENAYELEALMDEEIETHHSEHSQVASSIQTMADGMPALGIVAAVLGVIKTMGSITEPPEVLGHLIGGALVGTFLGVFLSYGFIGPIASTLKSTYDAETKYLQCIRVALLAYVQGYAPSVAIEFARKALLSDVRPTFYEVEEAVSALPAATA